jgi:hypothetical protein
MENGQTYHGRGPAISMSSWTVIDPVNEILGNCEMPRRRFTTSRRSPQPVRRRPAFEPLESRCLLAALALLDEEQLVLESINRARANPAAEAARLGIDLNEGLLPGTLSATPKQPLAPQQLLLDVAAAHSQDMIERKFFAHVNPDGADPGDRIAAAGYSARSWGENIAIDAGAVQAHDLLFRSAGHRVNMLRDSFRELGVGVRVRDDWGVTMTEVFASRTGDVFLTGVAFSDQVLGDDFFSLGEGLDGVTITATARNRGTTYTTITGPTGGYSLQVPTDTYDLEASGGELLRPIAIPAVYVGAQNVKTDFVVPYAPPGGPAPPVAKDDRVLTDKDVPVVIDVLANDSGGVPFNPATVTIVHPPTDGQAFVDQATGHVTYTPAAGWTGPDELTYQVRDADGVWSPAARVLVTVIDRSDRPWQNPRNARDVDADHDVTVVDVLILVNDLNAHQARPLPAPSLQGDFPPPYLDVNGDGRVDPRDVLDVINYINGAAAGEGEASGGGGAAAFDAVSPLPWDAPRAGLTTSPSAARSVPEPDSRFWPAATPADLPNLPVRPDHVRRSPGEHNEEPELTANDVPFPADLLQAIDAIAGR